MPKQIYPTLPKGASGFTLIELLIVIAILVALAVTVFVALNPAQRLMDARDARRSADVDSILQAVHSYIVDNQDSSLPAGIGTVEEQIGTATTGCNLGAVAGCNVTATACRDLGTPLANYLKSMPVDPLTGSLAQTKYSIIADTDGIVTVRACGIEGTNNFSTSR